MMTPTKNPGFTLIELLVVIAIIGILSSVVLASLSGARESAQITRTVSDFEQIETALTMWMQNTGRTEWPHPEDDLNIPQEDLYFGDNSAVRVQTLAEETSLGDYISSVPAARFGQEEYLYRQTSGFDNCSNRDPWDGTNLRISGVSDDISEKVSQIVDGDKDLSCGKVTNNASSQFYYLLSNDNSF